ncbi:MAG: ArsA-related P-loop ATPase [Baekduia sp.]
MTIVTGKGGTGKSVITAALGVDAASRGHRVLLAETHGRTDVARLLGAAPGPGDAHGHAERELAPGLHHVSIDTDQVLAEYLEHELPGPVAALAGRSRGLATLVAATPGLRELLTVGKIWEMAQPERRLPGGEPYDAVIVDAPATGHGIAMFTAPATFAEAARGGPVHDQAKTIATTIGDPALTRFLAVATPEELPVAETLEITGELQAVLPEQRLHAVIVNRLLTKLFSAADRERLAAAGSDPVIVAALTLADQRAEQQHQLTRLRRGLPAGVAVRTVPALTTAEVTGHDLAAIGRVAR